MKKALSILLVLVICLSLCACGSSNDAPKATDAPVEATESKELRTGDSFGTDNVECVIKEYKWLTAEEFKEHSTRISGDAIQLSTDVVFPGYKVWGTVGMVESNLSDNSFLCVTYSLQNVGKEGVEGTTESAGFAGMFVAPYGTIEVIYDDGYTFDFGDGDLGKYSGFTTPLRVLGDPVEEVMIINLPNQVFKNDDKPLKLKITLPSSNGDVEEFIVSIR